MREALTNVRKHAPGTRVLVQIGYRESQVRVVVSNEPATRSAGSELSATGSGFGLVGLRQRVELLHGTLRAGPTPDGGFRLEAGARVRPDSRAWDHPKGRTTPSQADHAERAEHAEKAEQPEPAVRSA